MFSVNGKDLRPTNLLGQKKLIKPSIEKQDYGVQCFCVWGNSEFQFTRWWKKHGYVVFIKKYYYYYKCCCSGGGLITKPALQVSKKIDGQVKM